MSHILLMLGWTTNMRLDQILDDRVYNQVWAWPSPLPRVKAPIRDHAQRITR